MRYRQMFSFSSSNRVFVEVVLVSSVEQEEGWGVKALCWASAGSKTTAIENTFKILTKSLIRPGLFEALVSLGREKSPNMIIIIIVNLAIFAIIAIF